MRNKETIDHVAIIMDGNGRWATSRKLKRSVGHEIGINNCVKLLRNLDRLDFNIKNLSFYVFSTENWSRPLNEIKNLFNLIERYYSKFKDTANEENLIIRHLGSNKKLSPKIKKIISDVVDVTKMNKGTKINLAFNYGGRAEIIDSVNSLNHRKLNENILSKNLYLSDLPNPDLIIRTGGEIRLSNFLLWQSAYSELFFTKKMWPDFKVNDLNRMLNSYKKRKRKYGS